MKNKILLLLFPALLLSGCTQKNVAQNVVRIDNKEIKVVLAKNEAEWERGLSGKPGLGENEGMLFIFPGTAVRKFWMKDMNFNLDIIWIRDNRIIKISKNLPREGDQPKKIYSSDRPVNYVIEVNAGWTDRNNIKVGDEVKMR